MESYPNSSRGTQVETRKPHVLAEDINEQHRLCEAAVGTALSHAMEAGSLLQEAKAGVKHGEWGTWLAENFEGSDRTARAYMRVHANRDEIEEKRQSSTVLSLDGALDSIAAPKADERVTPDTKDTDSDLIRELAERYMHIKAGQDREAFERVVENEDPSKEELRNRLFLAEMGLLGATVAVDGFLFEDAPKGGRVLQYRAPLGVPAGEKDKIVSVPLPAAEAIANDPDLAECVKRGCWQMGILEFKAWRSLRDWFARALVADPATPIEQWEKDVAFNADWRQCDPAAEFLTHRAYHPGTTRQEWAKDHDLKPSEFKKALEVTEWMVGDFAERLWQGVTGTESDKIEKYKRWKAFETSGGAA